MHRYKMLLHTFPTGKALLQLNGPGRQQHCQKAISSIKHGLKRVIVVGCVICLFPSSSRKDREKLIPVPNTGCIDSLYFNLYFPDTKVIALNNNRAQFGGRSSYSLYEKLSEARKLESLGKSSNWSALYSLFWCHKSCWPSSGFWIVDKCGILLLWWCSSITLLECYITSMFKQWKIWRWGTSAKDQAVQTGKEEKEVHGKKWPCEK